MTAAEHPSDAPEAAASTEVVAVAKRRKFTSAYMQRIVREADACTAPGAIGALLRREGLYSLSRPVPAHPAVTAPASRRFVALSGPLLIHARRFTR